MTEWQKHVLVSILPLVLPSVVRSICMRAGLDREALADRRDGFDVHHYERLAGRRFAKDETALLHYLLVGSREGLRPNARFDPARYLRENPDVAMAGYEPFAHYFRFGRYEGRGETTETADDALPRPDLSRMLQYPRRETDRAAIDIVMPVYGNRRLTVRAIDSVLKSRQSASYELIVIDDGSPEPNLRRDLEALAQAGHLTLLVNERNLGFVSTANRGFALHADRDVVLLNSDTEVYGDWLDRLLAVLHGSPTTGTVSPISNAATILSYPIFLRDNDRSVGVDFPALDCLCGRLGHAPVELPTALGFCMAVKRACLTQVGSFDEESFGRGYGEENDFSLRATAAGWGHLAATNVFVWHRGGASFGPGREVLIEAAQRTLERMYPGYAASVQHFIARDPLRPIRQALDIARICEDSRRKVLYGCRPDQRDDDAFVLALLPEMGPFVGSLRIHAPALRQPLNLPRIERESAVDDLAQMLCALNVKRFYTKSTPESALRALSVVRAAAKKAGVETIDG